MHKTQVGILVVAQGISQEAIQRFKDFVAASSPTVTYQIMVGSSKNKVFYKTRILNYYLRKMAHTFEVIIQTDIDLVIPPKIIDESYQFAVANRSCYHHNLRYIDPSEIQGLTYNNYPWEKWRTYKAALCSGCWNAMSVDTWFTTGGYNEDMYGWGSEDTEFFMRCLRRGINMIKKQRYALMHLNHPPRQPKRAKENMQMAANYLPKTDWLRKNIIKS